MLANTKMKLHESNGLGGRGTEAKGFFLERLVYL